MQCSVLCSFLHYIPSKKSGHTLEMKERETIYSLFLIIKGYKEKNCTFN